MNYVLAIDVGTSFTAAAVSRFGQGISPAAECLPLGLRGTAVPSVVYYPEEGSLLVGEAAERRSLDFPGQVVREFKRRVGDAVPISVGGLSLPPEDVFATMARWVVDRAVEREGAQPSEVVVTHPAAWGTHRTSMILAAMGAQGLDNITLVTEPVAAALYYASQVRVEVGSTIAVYDLGGGTFDTAVLRKAGSSRFQLLGRPEGIENLGGADFDAEVFRYVAEHTGGVLSTLNPADDGVRGALGRLRRECVEAKEALSSDSEATISVLLPGFQQQIRLVRSEFEALIEEPVRDTVEALEQTLAQLELEPADLSAVLLIGGSSRIPLVAQLISEQLDRPIAVDADPKSSICLGAALSAVLARAEAESRAAVAALPAGAARTAVGLTPGTSAHAASRHASWSRKGTTAGGAVAGVVAPAHVHGGAHAPKPTVRVTAIAAAAALVSVLTATTAQSPAGFTDLTAIFVPKAGAAPEPDPTADSAGGAGGGPVAAAAVLPAAGVGADMTNEAVPYSGPGLDVEASPTSRPLWRVAAENGPAAVAGLDVATGGPAGPAAAGPGAVAPDANAAPPVAIDPVTGEPVPTDPLTGEPVATDPVTGEPVPPVTEPPSTGEPGPTETEPPSTAEPEPTATDPPPTAEPEPTGTASPAAPPEPTVIPSSPVVAPEATQPQTGTPTASATPSDVPESVTSPDTGV
ncbi:Hsp70 family protein [Arthrobacter sp. OV608]|uniref:Hsp70 family protein n=1 Tax=Arthrobacter sp. OV608 TaxID=1882768 RepID=UPI0008B5DF26|nr:Hsp70 family protein [Arthrobacter sp. OV608]SEP90588.1 Hsp70 protein [Arthrobacter sp. OV608]